MNAIKFIKEHGVEKARGVVAAYHGTPSYTFKEKTGRGYSACQSVELSDLKRLVESVDLVKRYGGIAEVKTLHQDEFWSERVFERLKQAIADYKDIFGGEHV